MATPLSPIFHNAQQGRAQQRGCLANLAKVLSAGGVHETSFLDCLDVVLLPSKASGEVDSTLEFIARAVYLREGLLLGPSLKVRAALSLPARRPRAPGLCF